MGTTQLNPLCRSLTQSPHQLLEQVTAADPTNVLAHYRLSAVYRKLNRPEDARRELVAYQKFKDIKEKLRNIYKEMRLGTPQPEEDK